MSAILQPATDAVRLYGQKTVTEMNTPHSVVIATRIITQDAAVVMHCFMRMMHTIWTGTTTALSAITMRLTEIALYTTTATSLNLYSTAILSDISALSWRLTVQEKTVITPTNYLLSPTETTSICTLRGTDLSMTAWSL